MRSDQRQRTLQGTASVADQRAACPRHVLACLRIFEQVLQQIASQGGKAAHEKGTAHEFSSDEAREAGRKGGQNSHSGGNQSNNR